MPRSENRLGRSEPVAAKIGTKIEPHQKKSSAKTFNKTQILEVVFLSGIIRPRPQKTGEAIVGNSHNQPHLITWDGFPKKLRPEVILLDYR